VFGKQTMRIAESAITLPSDPAPREILGMAAKPIEIIGGRVAASDHQRMSMCL
jgi:hypothetical protein